MVWISCEKFKLEHKGTESTIVGKEKSLLNWVEILIIFMVMTNSSLIFFLMDVLRDC